MSSFSPASDIQTQALVWSAFSDGEQVVDDKDVPLVHSAAYFASRFSLWFTNE